MSADLILGVYMTSLLTNEISALQLHGRRADFTSNQKDKQKQTTTT